tara:strand:- start:345 stop:986 length:642 start_codon:yes stop_codon:yes gene_type:complete
MPYLGNEVAPLVQALEGKELKLDSDGDSSIQASVDDTVVFKTNGSNRWTLNSSGNLFPASTSQGIVLGATSDTSANRLDHYEEGTWTPTFVLGSTACTVTSEGNYTKVGRVVTINMFISITNTNSGSGTAKVQSLPFAVADLLQFTSVEANGSVSLWSGFPTGMSSVSIFAQTSQQAELQGLTSGTQTATTTLNNSHFDSSCEFRASVTYFTT